jgi:dTDP-4-dehydrorhamnose 3,5-epimerase
MRATPTDLAEVLIIEPDTYRDSRGYFRETWNAARHAAHGVDGPFVQDNFSCSGRAVLRGLHFQNPNMQAKLVSVSEGEIFDVAVDVRAGSPTFGRWTGVTLSADAGAQLYVPEGFAHGFCVLGERATVFYKVSAPYDPASEITIRWDDPALGIDWPIAAPVLSDRDRAGACLDDIPLDRLPPYRVRA